MGARDNTMSGKTWIGEGIHLFYVDMAGHLEAQQREALESGDNEPAERCRSGDSVPSRNGEHRHGEGQADCLRPGDRGSAGRRG